MSIELLAVSALYVTALVYSAFRGKRASRGKAEQFLLAGSGVGFFLGFLTFSATLFSAFTLVGMPDFFRTHGVGAWIFLGVSDTAMAFVILWFGLALRRRIKGKAFVSMSDMIFRETGGRVWAFVYLAGAFLFLLPYIIIQIRGIAIFIQAVVPINLGVGFWGPAIIAVMFLYSAFGGLRAIIYSDAIQGIILLIVTWIIASACLSSVGGIEFLFKKVGETNPELLSVPGPSGLFGFQFLLSSFIAIAIMPLTQPQLLVRLAIMKNDLALRTMSVAFGFFALLAILPTAIIGFYGAVKYSDLEPAAFISKVMTDGQTPFVSSLAIVGLIAAAMSTTDSILFALGNEVQSLFPGDGRKAIIKSKAAILAFSVIAAVMSLISNDQLALLGRLSFTGTAMLAPIISTVVYRPENVRKASIVSAFLLMTLIFHLTGAIPKSVFSLRIDLLLLMTSVLSSLLLSKKWHFGFRR